MREVPQKRDNEAAVSKPRFSGQSVKRDRRASLAMTRYTLHCTRYFTYTQDMTLHETAETLKKTGIGSAIGIGVILVLVIFFQIGVFLKNTFFPPVIDPPNLQYGALPGLVFPPSVETGEVKYYLNTETGQLPEFPDRVQVFPIIKPVPGLDNLERVKAKILLMGFKNPEGDPIPEIRLDNSLYEWNNPFNMQKKVIYNIETDDFDISSNYAQASSIKEKRHLSNQDAAINKVQEYLTVINLLESDIDLAKTKNQDLSKKYITYPEIYTLNEQTEQLFPATALNNAHVIRVDLYQKDLEYELNAKQSSTERAMRVEKKQFPLMYPRPPYSTMNFLVASGVSDQEIVQAEFVHQSIDLNPPNMATYPIKSAQQAFDELNAAKAYIAKADRIGSDRQVNINNVYLAYYLGKESQDYLLPIVVFEGEGFFAYIPAITDLPTQEQPAP